MPKKYIKIRKTQKQTKLIPQLNQKKEKKNPHEIFFSFTFLPTNHTNTSKTKSSLIHFLFFSSTFLVTKHRNPSKYQIPQE